MNADIKGALKQLNKVWHLFEHKGKHLTRLQVEAILRYALKKGLKSTDELTDKEVDEVLNSLK